jgi:hypothetical protein
VDGEFEGADEDREVRIQISEYRMLIATTLKSVHLNLINVSIEANTRFEGTRVGGG